jgi:broad specificity phosphatase PhoE
MKPNRIILIRHGESQGNVDANAYANIPDYALELTEKGKAQASEAGKKLKNIVGNESLFFYVSPMWRTRSTFEQVAKAFDLSQLQYIEEPRIREQEWGNLRNLSQIEDTVNNRDAYGTFYYRMDNGESAADVFDRMSDFMGTLHRDFEKPHFAQNTVLVTHSLTIRLFLMRWFKWTVEEYEHTAGLSNCEIIVLEKTENDKYILTTELKKYDSVYHNFQRPIQL